MIPFNKEKYLSGAKVTYRNGQAPTDIFWSNSNTYLYVYSLRKVHASDTQNIFIEELIKHTPEGLVSKSIGYTPWDLIMEEDIEVNDQPDKKRTFKIELCELINKHSKENGSDTPDFILAKYLNDCLKAFNKAIQLRTKHYDHGYQIPPRPLQTIAP